MYRFYQLREIILLWLLSFCCVLIPNLLYAQVTIKEDIIFKESITTLKQAGSVGTFLDDPVAEDEAYFIAENSGQLHIYLASLSRYLDPVPSAASLHVRILGSRDTTIIIPMEEYFDSPFLRSKTGPACPQQWYLYGKGPFPFYSRPGPEDGKDTFVSSYYRIREGEDDTYRDFNFENDIEPARIQASYKSNRTSSSRLEEERYGFLQFELPSVRSDSIIINRASLSLDQHSGRIQEDDYFELRLVSSPWEENEVTWNTQPDVFESPVLLVYKREALGGYAFDIGVEAFANQWIGNGTPNNGIRVHYPKEQGDGEILFYDSEHKYQFLRPALGLEYSNAEGLPTNALRKLPNVAKGDTVLISYTGNASEPNRPIIGGPFSQQEIAGDLYIGRRFLFISTEKASFACDNENWVSELLEGLVFVEEQDSLQITMEVPMQNELWPTIPSGGAQANFDRSQIENTIEEIIVEVTQDDEPAYLTILLL